jgi:hypothetical protein
MKLNTMNQKQLLSLGLILLLSVMLNSCTDSGDEIDPCLNGPELNVDEVISSNEGQDDGEITVSATKGTAPYQYSIDGTTVQSSGTFTGLAPDVYTLTVNDENGCMNTETATVEEIALVSYADEVRPIIDANCQISNCHGSNGNIPTFATYADVKAKADRIKARTEAKSMPPSGPLSDDNIKLIADWVVQGAIEN